MSVYLPYIFYGTIFLSVLLLVEGLFYLLAGPGGGSATAPNRRLRMLVGGKERADVMVRLQRERALPNSDHSRNPIEWFQLLVTQSAVQSSPRRVGIAMLVVGVGAMAAGIVVFGSPPIGVAAAVVIGLVLPILMLLVKRRIRLRQISAQLPDSIDIIVRSLRAGHPISTSISMVSREMRDPIATEVGLVVDEMTYGLNLDDALMNMARRVGLDELRFLVVAVMIQMQVGGNLAEVLSGLSRVIRERAKMRAKIRALSAEGRFSAVLLSVLPFLLIGAITLIRPTYYSAVAADPVFWPILGVGFALMVLGIIVMYRLVNFRV